MYNQEVEFSHTSCCQQQSLSRSSMALCTIRPENWPYALHWTQSSTLYTVYTIRNTFLMANAPSIPSYRRHIDDTVQLTYLVCKEDIWTPIGALVSITAQSSGQYLAHHWLLYLLFFFSKENGLNTGHTGSHCTISSASPG